MALNGNEVFEVTGQNSRGLPAGYGFLTNISEVASYASHTLIEDIGITIDGGGTTITTGSKGFRDVPFAGNIISYVLLADQSGSVQLDVKKSTYSGFPTTSTIVAAAPPILSSAQKNTDSTLTGWTKAIASGDILEFSVTSATTVTRVQLFLRVQRTGS